jgi:class 3 adenylate cyclase/tetratricopeptide (TPR) repeat protein
MTVCPSCRAENPANAKFCNECGASLAVAAPREQRKTVTVLFCDVSGSTSLAERVDPEALRAIMARYFDVARTAIERHGGTVEKFIGDAVMAVFGIPVVHEDDALRAVRAALELRDAVEIDVRIGVNTGEVVTGGADTLATGDSVNVAARLEQAAGTGEVLLGEQTYALVRDAVDAELLPPLGAKGKSEPLTAYRLRSVTGGVGRRDAAPMVGRAAELDLLARAYERAVHERACHLFTVLGTAGIGKSRLVSEFLAGLHGARVVHGRCLSYGEGITYWPVVEVVKQLGDLTDDDTVRKPIAALLGESDAVSSPPEIAWAVRKLFEHAALDRPLAVVFDDIHWGEATFLDLIEHVADLSRGAPILLLCMARPELLDVRPGWAGGKHNATSVLLEPLPSDAVDELVRALAGDVDPRIREAADGNPLFVEEMVELARAGGGDVAVPPTIQALLTARLDSLPAEERAVLERGSVEGQVFHRNAVAALGPEEPQVDTRLVSLVRKELVRPDQPALPRDDAYRFRHLLIRDAAYEALPKTTRIELHERFATWLEEHGADLVELDEIVGYHLEQAVRYSAELGQPDEGRAARAAERLAAAARRAELRGDAAACLNLLQRADVLHGPDDPRRPRLLLALGTALYENGRVGEAIATFDEAIQRGDAATAARARVARINVISHSVTTSYSFAPTLRELDHLLPALAGDDEGLAEAELTRALLLYYAGRNRDARDAAQRAYDRARQIRDVRLIGLASEVLGSALSWSDTPWDEVERFARARVDEDVGPRSQARIMVGLGRCLWMRGDFEHGRSMLYDALRRYEDLGQRMLAASHWMTVAHLEWAVGDWDAYERSSRACWDELGAVGEEGFRSTAGAQLADALIQLGRIEEAEQILDETDAITSPDDYVTRWAALGARARIAALRGDAGATEELVTASLAAADTGDSSVHSASARIVAAEAYRDLGVFEEARRLVEQAVSLAEEKNSVAIAARARAVVATMPA